MDRNEAYKKLDAFFGETSIAHYHVIDLFYDNNCEIVDRSIPEEHIREMINEKE